MNTFFRLSTLTLSLAAALAATPVLAQATPNFDTVQVRELKVNKAHQRLQQLQVRPKRYIVKLAAEPLATYGGGQDRLAATSATHTGSEKLDQRSAAAQQYRSFLKAEQGAFASQLKRALPAARIERHYDTTFNGLVVSGQGLSQKQLAGLPGVSAVYPERWYQASMDSSLSLVKAPAVWQALSTRETAGKGIRVAVIDSGIRPENPMFADTGFTAPTDLPTDDYCRTTDPSFCNNKLIVARWSKPNAPVWKDEFMSPLGMDGHGTHVAGTAVGNPVKAGLDGISAEISGVAPGAYLMVYKALFADVGDPTRVGGSNIQLMEALEFAVKDGADVINNSWGGGNGGDPAFTPYEEVFEAAEKAGVVMVTAAGNDGPTPRTIGCPGCTEAGITVANTQHGRQFLSPMSVEGLGQFTAIEGGSSVRLAALPGDLTLPLVATLSFGEESALGCNLAAPAADGRVNPFAPESLKGVIALVSRGACSFDEKAKNAAEAGASAIIIGNNQPGLMAMSMPTAPIPGVMVSKADAERLWDALEAQPGLRATLSRNKVNRIDAALVDQMNPSSSRGPNGDAGFLKPDLGAPGSDILSAMAPSDPGSRTPTFALLTGTSMASPHVAGAAALLKAQHPDWDAFAIKTALTSTSVGGITKNDDGQGAVPATPFDIGAGRLDIERASKAGLAFDRPSIASSNCVVSCSAIRIVKNLAPESAQWTPRLSFTSPAVTGTVSASRVQLGKGGSRELSFTFNTAYATPNTWHFGQVSFTDNSGRRPAAVMPIALYVGESDNATLLSTRITPAAPGEPLLASTVINNAVLTEAIDVQIKLPAGASLANGAAPVVTNGRQSSFSVDRKSQQIRWSGSLGTAKLDLEPTTALPDFVELKSNGGVLLDCGVDCDESELSLDLAQVLGAGAHIKYNGGEFSTLKVSSNGYLAFGNESAAVGLNQKFPDNKPANNILAPFWADLDLVGSNEGDAGGGQLYGHVLEFGDASWLALEWNQAKIFNDPSGNTYTFQVWMKVGGDEIYFNYLNMGPVPEGQLSGVTVGAEDRSGTIGVSRFFNGEGTAPSSHSALKLRDTAGGKLELNYGLNIKAAGKVSDDAITVQKNVGAAINVLENDLEKGSKGSISLLHSELRSGGSLIKGVKRLGGGLDRSSLAISTAPVNGTAEVGADGFIAYTPNSDFVGQDRLIYVLNDVAGNVVHTATVNITVQDVPANAAPELPVVTGASSAIAGETVTLSAEARDSDSSELRYRWTQVRGTPVVLKAGKQGTHSFVAPNVDEVLEFQVVANDGELDSPAASHRVTVSRKAAAAPLVYENRGVYVIPDAHSRGVSSPITVLRRGDAGRITVDVELSHRQLRDVSIELVAPNGKRSLLVAAKSRTGRDLKQSFTLNASGIASQGVWQLRVIDHAPRDSGSLLGWKLRFAR